MKTALDYVEVYYGKHHTCYLEESSEIHSQTAFDEQVTEQHRQRQTCASLKHSKNACLFCHCGEEQYYFCAFPVYHEERDSKDSDSLPFIKGTFDTLLHILPDVLRSMVHPYQHCGKEECGYEEHQALHNLAPLCQEHLDCYGGCDASRYSPHYPGI